MKSSPFTRKTIVWFIVWVIVATLSYLVDGLWQPGAPMSGGLRPLQLVALVAAILACSDLIRLFTEWSFARKHKPLVEASMIGRIYQLLAGLGILVGVAYAFGQMGSFATFFSMFGGLLLGWSLQAPVSGVAAWVLISVKRPIRPGDRVQFPTLGLVGDVKEVGIMYTVLDQVGGSIGSEEAVGRFILVPNAMLFSQVVINYTVTQEAAYMLDEVVIRITYDSDWNVAEELLRKAAIEVTGDVMAATGVQPYIRSDLYDYGVYLRLRYQTRVKNRAETAYEITKRIFGYVQQAARVDLAIPYIYSYRAGADRRNADAPPDKESRNIREIEIARIHDTEIAADPADVEALAKSISSAGLLQPVLVTASPQGGYYDLLAGHLRLEACKKLGWRTIPAVVREHARSESAIECSIIPLADDSERL